MAKSNKKQDNTVVTLKKPDLPAHLKKHTEMVGLNQDMEHRPFSPPKLIQIVAKSAAAAKLEEFGQGSLVLDKQVLAKFNSPVKVCILFYWLSWQKRKDNDDKTQDFFILDETVDPNHEIAKNSRNPNKREEPYPQNPKMNYTYCESVNFIVEIQGGEFAGTVAAVKFAIGSHDNGRRLYEYLKRQGVDLFCNIVEIEGVSKANSSHDWMAINFNALEKATERYVGAKDLERVGLLHKGFVGLYDQEGEGVAEQEE